MAQELLQTCSVMMEAANGNQTGYELVAISPPRTGGVFSEGGIDVSYHGGGYLVQGFVENAMMQQYLSTLKNAVAVLAIHWRR